MMLESDRVKLKQVRIWMRHLALNGHPRGLIQYREGPKEVLDLVYWMDEYINRDAPKQQKADPVCSECNLTMHRYAANGVQGWGCDGCGWSDDD